MTKHEADVIGGLNMTDQISNEAYKQIMIAAQDENEVGDVLDEIRAEIWDLQYGDEEKSMTDEDRVDAYNNAIKQVIEIIDKYKAEGSGEE